MSNLYIIAGPNGAGKTTASYTVLPDMLNCKEFVNAVTLTYWLNSPELAIERIKTRVNDGGHNIADDVVRRRYKSGIKNFFNLYLPISDYWMIIDNSENPFQFVAEGNTNKQINITNHSVWNQINLISNG